MYFLILFSLAFASCKDIQSENIEGKMPVLLVPASNDTVQVNPVKFKWEAMEGATKYRLQVASPSFANPSEYALDTTVSLTEFDFALDSNEYELKLTALNSGYQSLTLGPIKFWVGIEPTITNDVVVLNSPTDNIYVNGSFTGSFNWNSLSDVSSYEFNMRQGSNFNTGIPFDFQNNLATNSVNLSSGVTLSEGTYVWAVKAFLNSGTETPYAKRTLFVDVTNPNTPLGPFAPIGNEIIGNVTFSWSNGSDNGTIKAPVTSTLQISTDSGFGTLWGTFTVSSNQAIVDMTSASANTYYWRVINQDEAGNVSLYSATNSFLLN